MAAPLTGKNGAFTIPTPSGALSVNFDQWVVTVVRDLLELPDYWDSAITDNWIEQVGLRYDLKGAGRCYIVSTMPVLGDATDGLAAEFAEGSATDFVLQADTGNTYDFPGIVAGFTHTVRKREVQVFNVTFESTGAVLVDGGP